MEKYAVGCVGFKITLEIKESVQRQEQASLATRRGS